MLTRFMLLLTLVLPLVGQDQATDDASTTAAVEAASPEPSSDSAKTKQDTDSFWTAAQKSVNGAFDKVTTPLEILMTRKVISVQKVTVFQGPTKDWLAVRDAIYAAGLVNWRAEPEFLTKEVALPLQAGETTPAVRTETVRDADGIVPIFDPKSQGSIDVKLADKEVALDIITKLGLTAAPTLILQSDSPDILAQAASTLTTAGIAVTQTTPGDDNPGTIAVPLDNEAAALAALAGIDAETISDANVGADGIWFIVAVLVFGGLFFTFWYKFIHVRLFRHAIDCVRGRYDNPEDDGEISHFKALTSALSATVGLGNIAGVAVAIVWGGPGAVFWMWVIAFFGMTMKFNSCFLGQLFRRVKDDGSVLGGPMVYLDDGIRKLIPSLGWLGKALGVMFALLCVMAAFGGGNMFQANQMGDMVASTFVGTAGENAGIKFMTGVMFAILTGIVIIGGIKRIGDVTSKIVPAMCGLYCVICLIIILGNVGQVPEMFSLIFSDAFSPRAMITGGFIGVLFQAMKRAAFSNEAGLGSAAIAHAAAKTDEPVREGVVAMLGPFIDTIVVCTMTALAILVTKSHLMGLDGVLVTANAFGTVLGTNLGNIVLMVMVCVFAYSTLISWCYYGERSVEYLVGEKGILPYRIVYVAVAAIGPVLSLDRVIGFSDMMLLGMAFPNIIGSIILAPFIKAHVTDYLSRLKSGAISPLKT